ncbi:transmembrane and coiled-coil domains protein 1-like isoform X19 [Ostrea edulis]|uniref:transmembrane and coiled-coil domains protein 1-like isoform X19 n=1 Tax=Ostrea edulis TaxID=37623 RepID=UPI0024AFA194|nr:transmembrane and coiled-coil domains protein 1-like isoform X19 [Ostrea edulis]XP_055995726.1 transmembrane and coiled-coil domains protein 1-like isoform X19 [Ostrea edulis]
MKKSDAHKTAKSLKKISASKSPSLSKKESTPPENAGAGSKPRSGSYNLMPAPDDQMVRSNEDLESVEVSSRENGSSGDGALDDIDGDVATGSDAPDPQRTKAAIEHYQSKVNKTMEQIKAEQAAKEENVNEYLRLAASANADKQQLARIKAVFEKKNQKSTQSISNLQKKLEGYTKRIEEIQTSGVTGHKKAKEVLSDMGHGLKFRLSVAKDRSKTKGGVVGNIKGAKDTMMAKPKEFAHLIKNKFGSADNINQMKSLEEAGGTEGDKQHGGTLPASFKYPSEDDNSSILSGSNYEVQSSPLSNSQNTSQQFPGLTPAALDPIFQEMDLLKENNKSLSEMVTRLTDELHQCKRWYGTEVSALRQSLEEEGFKYERLEEQMNDMTELNQNEFSNLRQDISSMEEKIEYRLDERTTDLQDNVENCQTRISKMELQQQQQQIISMEMVENVTFRTLLTKLINVVLAIVAVILVVVSTAANLVAPFLTTRARILSSALLVVAIVIVGRNWDGLILCMSSIWQYVFEAQPFR